MATLPERFCDEVLWPEFKRLDDTLQEYLDEVAQSVICKAFHGAAAAPVAQARTG